MIKISAVIITYNEEKNISRCIDSVREVADEVVVLDCFSKDQTKQICLSKGVSFHQNEFLGFAKQKNKVVSLASHDYVLSLDADEYLSSELTQSIIKIKADWKHDGYLMNRLSGFAGTWIKTCGWYPDQKLRLWDRTKGNWQGGGVHERVELISGSNTKNLKGDLFHWAYDNVSQFLQKNQSYSTIHAQANRYKFRSSTWKIFYKTTFAFFKAFILKGGILDGYKGLIVSGSMAHWVFFKYAKLLEANKTVRVSLIVESGGDVNNLRRLLTEIKTQKELPNELIMNGKSAQSMNELKDVLDDFPVPYRFVPTQGLNGLQDAVSKATEEYILIANDNESISPAFIKSHKVTAWKGNIVSGATAQKKELISKPTVWDNKLKEGAVSFWKEDWNENGKRIIESMNSSELQGMQSLVTKNKPIADGISVVIPNYNGKELFKQTFPPLYGALENCTLPFEIIVVDDCSTDESVSFLQSEYPLVRIIESRVNQGFSPTINKGIFQSKYELVFLLNSDVKLAPDYFGYLLPHFEKSDTFGVMGRIVNWEDDQIQDGAKLPTFQGAKIKTFKNFLPSETPIKKGLYTMYLSGAEALVSREKLLMLGGFDEIFAPYYVEDYEMCLRAWRLGWKCYYEHQAVCRHKTSSSIKSKSRKRQVQTIYYRNKIFLHAIHLTPFQMGLYYPQLFVECLLRLLSFRFYYLKAILLFFKEKDKCRQSKERFEALAKKVGTKLTLVEVAEDIRLSLNKIIIWRF